MRTLTYTRPHDLSRLHDELLAAGAIPLLTDKGTTPVQGLGDEIYLTVPDDADEQAIAAIVAAHDPTPVPEPDPDAELEAAIEAAQTDIDATATLEELKVAMRKLTDALLARNRGAMVKGRAVEVKEDS
jgi:hypothetical protein